MTATPATASTSTAYAGDDRPTMAELVAAWGVSLVIVKAYAADPVANRHDPAATTSEVVMSVAGVRAKVRGIPFTMGSGNPKPIPTAEEYLNALATDASCVRQYTDLDEFMSEFGSDPDDRVEVARSRKMWRACQRTHDKLLKVLGEERLDVLLLAQPL